MMAVEKRYVKISPFDLAKWDMATDPETGKRTYTLKAGQEPQTVTIGVEAEFDALFGFVDITAGCLNAAFYLSGTAMKCEYTTLTLALPAGETPVFVATGVFAGVECGKDYYLTIDGYDCTSPVENKTWGGIKALYK